MDCLGVVCVKHVLNDPPIAVALLLQTYTIQVIFICMQTKLLTANSMN